jgi:hypothetical protein
MRYGKNDGTLLTNSNIEWDDKHFCGPARLTPQERGMFGVVEVEETPRPMFNDQTHRCDLQGHIAGRLNWVVKPLPLEEVVRIKIDKVNSLRDAKIAEGMPWAFPDGPGVVQLRDERDIRNILIKHATGAGRFRDKDNKDHSLPETKMREMTLAVMKHIDGIYEKAMAHKDNLRAMTAWQEAANYDITEW